jgi:hypothetical protein
MVPNSKFKANNLPIRNILDFARDRSFGKRITRGPNLCGGSAVDPYRRISPAKGHFPHVQHRLT